MNWDRFFEVLKIDVEDHKADFEDDGVVNTERSGIYSWPGRNNNKFEEFAGFALPNNKSLAPFVDLNDNRNYEPDQGEYPAIKGDQSMWWVFNDVGNTHLLTNSAHLKVEVQVMAYASKSDEDFISNATFYDYKIINRGEEDIHDFYIGLWADPDIGCPTDDYFGYDIERHMTFIYNVDAVDGFDGSNCQNINTYGENIPMIGISLINSSFDKDENSSFSILTQSSTDYSLSYPFNAETTHKILSNENPITNPLTEQLTDFAFPDDPSDVDGWSMCAEELPFLDRTF